MRRMENSFRNSCYLIINKVQEKYEINSQDILLWIYLNMYTYNQGKFSLDEYNRQQFMEGVKRDKHFSYLCNKYEMIQEKEYLQLKDSIFQEYCTNRNISISVKIMEETYERILQESLRLKTGSYYTPQPIVEYMTTQGILSYIDSKISNQYENLKDYFLKKNHTLSMNFILQTIQLLGEIKIIDIACGGGVFLRQSLHFLYSLNKELYQLIGRNFNDQDLIKQIIQNNLYGVDIQENTTILCKLLVLIEAQNLCGFQMGEATLHIFNEDVLVIDFEKTIGTESSFDIVLGNPPYIGERGNKSLFQNIRQREFGEKYYERKMDYFYFFIYKAYEILKKEGILCYITTNYFVTADGAKKLRRFIESNFNFREIINFNSLNLFADAKGQHNMIFLLEKNQISKPTTLVNFAIERMAMDDLYEVLLQKKQMPEIEIAKISKENLYDCRGQISIQSFGSQEEVLKKVEKRGNYLLDDLCYVNQGIVSGADKLTASWAFKLGIEEDIGAGVFVLKEEELQELNLEDDLKSIYVKDFYKNSHIKKYHTLKKQGLYLLYIDDHNLPDIYQIPSLHRHLSKYKNILEQRREVQKGTRKWYALQWPRNSEIFEGEKIVVPQRALENTFSYVKEAWYASADVYYITAKNKEVSLYYLLGLLNSSLMYYWLFYRGKRKGEYLELYATPLKRMPIYYPSAIKKCEAIEKLVRYIIEYNHDKSIAIKSQMEIDKLVFQLYGIKPVEQEKIMKLIDSKRK